MRFLADENCDFAVIRALRADGHDVISVSDISPRAEDSEVINLAVREEGSCSLRIKISVNWFMLMVKRHLE